MDMNVRSVSEIIHRGGTHSVHTARCLEFKNAGGPAACGIGLPRRGYRRACGDWRRLVPRLQDMAAQSIPCIGIPGTIDNDIACSDYNIGYDTAMNTAVEMIDKLRDTTQSHDRCSGGGDGPQRRLYCIEHRHRLRCAGDTHSRSAAI